MRKIILLCVLAIGMMADAQTVQTIAKPLKLNIVAQGTAADSVLVRGADKIVKFVPRSQFGGDAQVNADWNASSGVSQILNRPQFKTINGNPIVGSGDIPINVFNGYSIVFDGDRAPYWYNGQISLGNGNELSAWNATDSNIYWPQTYETPKTLALSVNGNYADLNGNITIAGGSQVNSDWNATTGAAQILNKPLILPSYINSTIEDLGIGDNALTPLSTEGYNLAIGNWALSGNTTGTQNVGLGHYSLSYNTVGNYNVAIGVGALENSTGVASYNTAVGAGAQRTSQGGQNTSLGAISGDKITGNFNTTIGFQSGRALTSGNRNILIEMPYNDGVTTGSNNIIIDGQNQCGIITGSGNTIIGGYNGTVPNLSNQVYIGTGGGISRFEVDANGIYKLVAGAPVYTDNAAALSGGLVAGNIYRTATGQLMITY